MFMCISKDCSAESQKRGLTPFIFRNRMLQKNEEWCRRFEKIVDCLRKFETYDY